MDPVQAVSVVAVLVAVASCGREPEAPPVPDTVHGSWLHSYEEDAAGERVFRRHDFAFPPSRGRQGFEIRADGTFVLYGIGRDDRPTPTTGSWKATEDGAIVATIPGRKPLTIRIGAGRLTTRR